MGMEVYSDAYIYRPPLAPQLVKKQKAIMRERAVISGMPDWAAQIVCDTAKKHAVSIDNLMSKNRCDDVVKCRNEIQYLIRGHPSTPSYPTIGKWLKRDHTAVLWSVVCHSRDTGAPPLTNYDSKQAKRRLANMRKYTRGEFIAGLMCPHCSSVEISTVDTRPTKEGVRRRKECKCCKARFTTVERAA